MEIKSVIPITLRKRERTQWKESNYTAKAVICDDTALLKELLITVVLDIFKKDRLAICIGLGLRESMTEKLQSQFPESTLLRTFKPKGEMVVRPGAVVLCLTNQEDILRLIQYWGTLDGIQIIFPLENCEDKIINLVSTDSYIYRRHDFEEWNEIMSYAKVVITDTSVGKEFEIVFHKGDKENINVFLESKNIM